ncbi:hypothetical protein CSKR_107603 [Clonorchis sinensis]|uniref:Uncharacterized protein n=1 Tax=Clonorchis sinensis TaxID=79923 RepID=A0A3R7D9L1_CLOSI|nr:hypothetical protein CSKR_107603 [Clonorchis sinensis]
MGTAGRDKPTASTLRYMTASRSQRQSFIRAIAFNPQLLLLAILDRLVLFRLNFLWPRSCDKYLPIENSILDLALCNTNYRLNFGLVFAKGSTESLVYDILQLSVLHTGRLMFQLLRYLRYCIAGNYSTAHERFRPSWDSSAKRNLRGFVKLVFYMNPNWADFDKYTHLHINLVFTRDSTGSLVCDILQLNVLHKDRLMFQLIQYSRNRSIF